MLRNGEKVGEHKAADLPKRQLVSLMLGRELASVIEQDESDSAAGQSAAGTFVQVEGIGRKGMLQPLDLTIAKGEIVGLAGLLGSGRTETAKLIFGIEHRDSGEILVKGSKITLNSPLQAIQHGFALCPEDRKVEGIIPELTVRENIILALQAKLRLAQVALRTRSRKKSRRR